MPDWLLAAIGILAGFAVICGVFFIVDTPRPLTRKRFRLAARSGRSDEDGLSNLTGGWAPPDA